MLAGLLVPVGVLFVAITVSSARGYYQEITQQQNAGLAASLVDQSDIMLGSSVDQAKLESLTKMLAMTNPSVEIYVLDDRGQILGSGSEDVQLLTGQVDLDPIENLSRGAWLSPSQHRSASPPAGHLLGGAARWRSRVPLCGANQRSPVVIHS